MLLPDTGRHATFCLDVRQSPAPLQGPLWANRAAAEGPAVAWYWCPPAAPLAAGQAQGWSCQCVRPAQVCGRHETRQASCRRLSQPERSWSAAGPCPSAVRMPRTVAVVQGLEACQSAHACCTKATCDWAYAAWATVPTPAACKVPLLAWQRTSTACLWPVQPCH